MPHSTPGSLTSEQSSSKSEDSKNSKKIICTEVFDETSNPSQDGKTYIFAFSICLFICFINLVDRNYILVLGGNSRGVAIGGTRGTLPQD